MTGYSDDLDAILILKINSTNRKLHLENKIEILRQRDNGKHLVTKLEFYLFSIEAF